MELEEVTKINSRKLRMDEQHSDCYGCVVEDILSALLSNRIIKAAV